MERYDEALKELDEAVLLNPLDNGVVPKLGCIVQGRPSWRTTEKGDSIGLATKLPSAVGQKSTSQTATSPRLPLTSKKH